MPYLRIGMLDYLFWVVCQNNDMLTIISLCPDRQISPRDEFPEHCVSPPEVVVLARSQLHFCFVVEVELQILKLIFWDGSEKAILFRYFNFWEIVENRRKDSEYTENEIRIEQFVNDEMTRPFPTLFLPIFFNLFSIPNYRSCHLEISEKNTCWGGFLGFVTMVW